MKISVIIPVFDRLHLLPYTIDSAINQSNDIDEIIIIDDGSKEDIKQVLKPYQDTVVLIQTVNQGVSHARNTGIKNAKNKWLAFLDSDDEWMKDKIKKQADFHKNNPDTLFSHTGERWIRNNRRIKYPKRLEKPKGWCFLNNTLTCKIAASSVMMHKKIFEKIGYFDENLKVCEDYDFWLRVSFEYKIGLLDEELIIKKAGHQQLSNSIFAIDRYHIYSLEKFLNTKYHNEVKKIIEKKCQILIRGAIKYQNQEIYKIYSKKLDELKNPNSF